MSYVVYDLHVLLAVLPLDHSLVVGRVLLLLGGGGCCGGVGARAALVRIIVGLVCLHVDLVTHFLAYSGGGPVVRLLAQVPVADYRVVEHLGRLPTVQGPGRRLPHAVLEARLPDHVH